MVSLSHVHIVRICGLFDQFLLPQYDAIRSHKSCVVALSLPPAGPVMVLPIPSLLKDVSLQQELSCRVMNDSSADFVYYTWVA